MPSGDGNGQCLPSLPPATAPRHHPVARPGIGSCGRRIRLLTNHFAVRLDGGYKEFYQYNVTITPIDCEEKLIQGKGIGRKVMDKLYETYREELAGKEFAYDGGSSLFTVGPLPQINMEFVVVLEDSSARPVRDGSPGNASPQEGDSKRSRKVYRMRTFKVKICYTTKAFTRALVNALTGIETEGVQNALRALDVILRQKQAKRGCLLVRQSFFSDHGGNLIDLKDGGISGCRGFHSSFQTTQSGLSLNMDVSTTVILTPGPVMDFLMANLNITDARHIDWDKAKRLLKNLWVRVKHNKMEYKIKGLSEYPCHQQLFALKNKGGDGGDREITVCDYFVNKRKIILSWSRTLPCLNVGRPKQPIYVPIELCDLVSLQRYTNALSRKQRASLVEQSRQKPPERMKVITDALGANRYEDDPLLAACGIAIRKQLTEVVGRVLVAPNLKCGSAEDIVPKNGRWSLNNKTFLSPINITSWAIVNFSAHWDMSYLSRELINCGRKKGMIIERPATIIDEDQRLRNADPITRVNRMFQLLRPKFSEAPQFILCVLPEKKNCNLYGPWKKKNLHEVGVCTQCISPTKINDQYLTNVLLKINAKLGGTNLMLAVERSLGIPLVNRIPTLILGMDVSHRSPGCSGASIAAVVGSRYWPLISKYKASVRSQPARVEMIDSLYKPAPAGEDGCISDTGIMKDILIDFYQTSNKRKPEQIIIFRDGVSDSQFSTVLNVEVVQIIKAIENLGVERLPKLTVIIAQKKHHTKLFLADSSDNVPAGTVVDTGVVHPKNYDFYMCAHAGLIGTSRPTHYHVLLDEIGIPADDLQELIHSLSYVYQRSTTAISIVAPIAYAHLAAEQMAQFVKFEDVSETPSANETDFSEILPRLHPNVADSMFFC